MTDLTESILNSNAQTVAEKLKKNESSEEIKKMLVLKGFTLEQIQQIFTKAQQLMKKEELVKKFLQEIKPQTMLQEKKEIISMDNAENKNVDVQTSSIEQTGQVKNSLNKLETLKQSLEKTASTSNLKKPVQVLIQSQKMSSQPREAIGERRVIIVSKDLKINKLNQEIREAQKIMRFELHKGNSFDKCIELLLKSGFNEEEIKEILQVFIVKK